MLAELGHHLIHDLCVIAILPTVVAPYDILLSESFRSHHRGSSYLAADRHHAFIIFTLYIRWPRAAST